MTRTCTSFFISFFLRFTVLSLLLEVCLLIVRIRLLYPMVHSLHQNNGPAKVFLTFLVQVNPTIRRPVCTPVRPGLASNVRENDGRVIIVDSPPHEQTADEFPDSDQPNVCGRGEEAVSDILHHNQQLECASEEEITTTTSLEGIDNYNIF